MPKEAQKAARKRVVRKRAVQKRAYDNSSRRQSSEANRKLILETLVILLVEKKGAEVTFKEIAARCGLAERSIFRFYEDKAALHAEMDHYLTTYIEASVAQLRELDVAGFAKNAFRLFDQYESLVQAYIYSPFGQTARMLFRKKLNKLITMKLVQEKPLPAGEETAKRIAIICSLINAKIWNDIKIDHGYSGAEMGDAVKWAIDALVKSL